MFLEIHILRARKRAKEEKPGRDGGWTRARGGSESHQKETRVAKESRHLWRVLIRRGDSKVTHPKPHPLSTGTWEALQSFPNSQDESGLHLPRV